MDAKFKVGDRVYYNGCESLKERYGVITDSPYTSWDIYYTVEWVDGFKGPYLAEELTLLEHPETTSITSFTELKDTNPKDGIGATKLPLHLVPSTAIAMASLAHLDGALKYGKWNWRVAGVRASIYVDAAKRHLEKWFHGEDIDPDNGLPHLAMAMACLNIIVDAQACDKLHDDRPPRVDLGGYMDELTPHVARLTEKHKVKNPRHWGIEDSEVEL